MGGLEVSNKFLRCEKCLEIKRFTIKPQYPESKIKMNCRCSEKEVNLYEYLKELRKKEDFKIKCAKCQTEDPKEPKYCYQCQKIYCVKCSEFHSQLSNIMADDKPENKDDVNALIGHKVIGIDKVDFHCILHQNEKFIGFCKKCLLNYCSKCEQENLHKDHEVYLYAPLLIDKKKKELIKEGKKNSQNKIDYNHSASKRIRKKIKNAENKKQIETLSKENEKINQRMLEFFDILYEMYEKTKHKNYSIIYNVVNNINFNPDKLKFEKDKHYEEDAVALIEYLKTDFVMHNEESLIKANQKKEEKEKKEHEGNATKDTANAPHDAQLLDEKYMDEDDEEEKKEDKKEDDKKEDKKEEKKEEEKKEEKKEESKKDKKEREKKEKEEKAKKEKEDKERAKKEEKEKKEREKKEKEEKAKKEKEDKERAKKEEKEKKEREKKEKEEKAKKDKEDKAKKEKEDKEKAKKEKEDKAKKEKEDKAKKNKDKDKKDDKKGKDKGKPDEKDKKIDKRPSQPLPNIINTGASGKIGDRKEFLQKMMGGGGGMGMGMGMGMGRPAPRGPAGGGGAAPGEKPVQIEHTRNEGDTVEIINNIQVQKATKKKPKKINFADE